MTSIPHTDGEYVRRVWREHTGGGTMVDFVELRDLHEPDAEPQ